MKDGEKGQTFLFGAEPKQEKNPTFKPLQSPVWTRNKARLVQKYLRYFVFITKHGTYIDGFAGPQSPDSHDAWSARLVFDSTPRRFRNFFLCELEDSKIPALRHLETENAARMAAGERPKRQLVVLPGDFNVRVHDVLASGVIDAKQAAFCLLDQRTFECDWQTVRTLAAHKKENKIELFYFFGSSWFKRALAGLRHEKNERLQRWWGLDNFSFLESANNEAIKQALVSRFRKELGYKYAYGYPIYEEEGGMGKTMYFMIHASDHPEAIPIMQRAYRNAVDPDEPQEQLEMQLGVLGNDVS